MAGAASAVVAVVIVGANPGLLGKASKASDRLSAIAASFSDHKPRHAHRAGEPPGGDAGIPGRYRTLYKKAAAGSSCGVSWRVLAAIGYVESRHGASPGRSSAGALGPMQFMPATWRAYGLDGNHDGRKDINDPADAIPAAAGYLCSNGAGRNLRGAIWHYNHSSSYVNQVLAKSRRIR